jgi:hypothetical protein
MDFFELKVIRQFGASIIFFTGVLVLALGLWLGGSIFTPPLEHSAMASTTTNQGRGPSSIPANGSPLTPTTFDVAKPDAKPEAKVETFALDCIHDGAHLEFKSSARQVRLKTSMCRGYQFDLDKSNIVNRANGFEATLFQLEKGGFSSDYINLVDGQNQIAVQLKDSKGRTISAQITISRQTTL